MSRGNWQPGTSTYPSDYLIAVFDRQTQAEQAAETLQKVGFSGADTLTYEGPRDYAEGRAREESNWLKRALIAFWALSTDARTSRRGFLQALRDGKSNLLVHCPDDLGRAKAAAVVRGAGGYRLVHYGRYVVQAL